MAARFSFKPKSNPNYNPYGSSFTERQQAIIDGQDVEDLRRNEVTKIIRKAEKMNRFELAEEVYCLYENFLSGESETRNLSSSELETIICDCKERLQGLTPWKLEW